MKIKQRVLNLIDPVKLKEMDRVDANMGEKFGGLEVCQTSFFLGEF